MDYEGVGIQMHGGGVRGAVVAVAVAEGSASAGATDIDEGEKGLGLGLGLGDSHFGSGSLVVGGIGDLITRDRN